MKNILLFSLILLTVLSSCKTKPNSSKPTPGGKAGVMVMVMNKEVKNSTAGKTLWDILTEPVVGLPQDEPMFDATVITPNGLTDFIKTYRNIIMIKVKPFQPNKVKYYNELWSKEQALVKITANDTTALLNLIKENQYTIVNYFKNAERKRLTNYFSKKYNQELKTTLEENFGFSMNIPFYFKLRKKTKNFIWMSHETDKNSVGIMTYRFKYVGKGSFAKVYLLNEREKYLRENVPGPSDGSYMSTELTFPISYNVIKTPSDSSVVMLRGLWKVEGDLMGGPFISMAHLDKKNNEVIVTEGYVYNPSKPRKRNYIRQLDAILRTYTPVIAESEASDNEENKDGENKNN